MRLLFYLLLAVSSMALAQPPPGPSIGGGGPPSGAAGGGLNGTYPNPGLTDAAVNGAAFSQSATYAAGTLGLRLQHFPWDASAFSGADASVKINSCITALIAAGGGVCDASVFTGIQAMSQEIDLGTSASGAAGVTLTLLLPANATWNWHITNGTSCGIRLYNNTILLGPQASGGGGGTSLSTTAGASMEALLCTDPSPSAGGSYVRVENVSAFNDGASTLAHGVIHIQQVYDQSLFRNVIAGAGGNGDAWNIDNSVCCGAKFTNIQGYVSASGSGGYPLKVGQVTSISISDSTFNGAGTGKNNIYVNGPDSGHNATAISFHDIYMEKYIAGDNATPNVYVGANARTVSFDGGASNSVAGSSTQYIFENHSFYGLSVKGHAALSSQNGVNDVFNGRTQTTDGSQIQLYTTGQSGGAGSFIQYASTNALLVTNYGQGFNATPVFNLYLGDQAMVLTGNVTSSTVINYLDGQYATFQICQDGTGGRTFTWPANFKGGMRISSTPGSCSIQSFKDLGGGVFYATGPGASDGALPPYSGTTASIGGGALLAGACTSYTTTTVTGATTAMAVQTSPVADPGANATWFSYVSAANTVSTKVCMGVAGTPTATTYNLRVQ